MNANLGVSKMHAGPSGMGVNSYGGMGMNAGNNDV